MSQGEFDIIKRYFQRDIGEQGVSIGIGDDCAIVNVELGHQLVVTTDTLVAGVHFFEDVDPYRLGYKSLAVNLSDLAAMGAKAKWFSLAITIPEISEPWLASFCQGLFALADQHQVQLIGGDTTKGPLSITITAQGVVPCDQALLRSGAQDGDVICVSNVLGDGALGLAAKLNQRHLQDSLYFVNALEMTEPRLLHAQFLVGVANSCIDISDGLSQDINHILQQSNCFAEINVQSLPLSKAMQNEVEAGTISQQQAWQFALSGGDDYELLFTISKDKLAELTALLAAQQLDLYEIGHINGQPSVHSQQAGSRLTVTEDGQVINLEQSGWDHFK